MAEAWGREPKAAIENQIPYGEHESALLVAGASVTGLMCVESLWQGDLQVELTIETPLELKPAAGNAGVQVTREAEGWKVRAVFPLRVQGQKWFDSISLSVPEEATPGEYAVEAVAVIRSGGEEETVRQSSRLKVISKREVPNLFKVGALTLPSNENGEADERQENNTVLIKGKKTFFQGMMEKRKESATQFDSDAAAYVSVPIENKASCGSIVLVRMDFLDPDTGKAMPGFEIPYAAEHGDALGSEAVYQIVELSANSDTRVTLPIYTNDEVVEPGVYTARLSAQLFGTDIEVGRAEAAVHVVQGRWTAALATLLALCTALVGVAFAVNKRKDFFDMSSRDLILIALFGTVMFAVVNIPGTLLLNTAHVLLGPFGFLLTGFFYETLFYILLGALVALIPNTGVAALVIAVRFLMSSFIMGELSPLSIIHTALTATCLEGAFHLLGLTQKGSDARKLNGQTSPRRVYAAAFVLGLTDVYLSFTFFNLSMFFYRLYYAAWYLTLYLVVNGFLFTFIAVPFGFRLGSRLKATTNG
jgi:hypothetical protein